MLTQYSRTELLIGPAALARLRASHVAVFGVGGVGGYVVEALARSGVGALDLIDNDTVSLTNLNRQLIALHSTLGQYKVDVAAARIADIDPGIRVRGYKTFYLPETASLFDLGQYDYIVDCVDTVTAKVQLVLQAREAGTPLLSCMGAGNKMDPSAFRVADLAQTRGCPLARAMRQALKKRGVVHLSVVYSPEAPLAPLEASQLRREEAALRGETAPPMGTKRRATPGSNAFVPAAAGLVAAGAVIEALIQGLPRQEQ